MRPTKTIILIFFLTCLARLSFSQELILTHAPKNYQLFARDNSDSATVIIKGEMEKAKQLEEVTLKVFKEDNLYTTNEVYFSKKLFQASTRIDAGLHQYRFEIHIKKGTKHTVNVIADNVVCGDAYIITGQSNSHASSSLATYSSPYCRSFGVKTGYETYSEKDKTVAWGPASGSCHGLDGVGAWFKKNPYGVGVWGIELARLIVEKHKMPVCFINGGSGSSSIEENMLYPEQPSLETSFGRLAYRVDQAGLKDKIKAIFYHQGETNSDMRYTDYANNFDVLYKDWSRVYRGLEKIYLFQLHPGCGGNFQSELREIQVQNAKRYADVEIMSTTAVRGHDGCHFTTEGYYEFAQRIFPLVSRDFYDETPVSIITPPTLVKAYFQNPKELVLEFDQEIAMEEKHRIEGTDHLMKDQFFFEKGNKEEKISGVVDMAEVKGNKIVLGLIQEEEFSSISWLPGHYYEGTKTCYAGPWIHGKQNRLGALTFHQRKIEAPQEQQSWNGFEMLASTLNGVAYKIVFPEQANSKRNWIWRARFWGHEPQTDIALLEKGFHLVYINVGGLFGNNEALEVWDDFYAFVREKYQLHEKVVLEGMSRGGLPVFNWGNANAEKVACIYADAPVCDFKSWPGGFGNGKGSKPDWEKCMKEYGFTQKIALQYNGNPIDHMENIARCKVPVLNVVGDADKVVPVAENTALLEKRLKDLGWNMDVIHKEGIGHHPHSLKDPMPIVDFILEHTGNN